MERNSVNINSINRAILNFSNTTCAAEAIQRNGRKLPLPMHYAPQDATTRTSCCSTLRLGDSQKQQSQSKGHRGVPPPAPTFNKCVLKMREPSMVLRPVQPSPLY